MLIGKILIVGIFLLTIVGISGCIMIVNYAPRATKAMLYDHEQCASNMIINEQVPISAKVADELTGAIGAQIKDNTVKGIEATNTQKLK